MNSIISTLAPYLFKGSLLALASHFLLNIKTFVRSAMWQSIIQAVVLGLILFILDRILPSYLGDTVTTPSTTSISNASNTGNTSDIGNTSNTGLGNILGSQQSTQEPAPATSLQNFLNMFQSKNQQ